MATIQGIIQFVVSAQYIVGFACGMLLVLLMNPKFRQFLKWL